MQSQIEHLPRYRQIRWWFHARIAAFRTGWRRIICSHACLPAWSKIRWSTSCIKTQLLCCSHHLANTKWSIFFCHIFKTFSFCKKQINSCTFQHSEKESNPLQLVCWLGPPRGRTNYRRPSCVKTRCGRWLCNIRCTRASWWDTSGALKVGSLGTYDKMWQVKHQQRQISQIKSQTLEWRLEISSSFTAGWLLQYHWYFYFSKWPWPGLDRARTRGRCCNSRRHVSFHIQFYNHSRTILSSRSFVGFPAFFRCFLDHHGLPRFKAAWQWPNPKSWNHSKWSWKKVCLRPSWRLTAAWWKTWYDLVGGWLMTEGGWFDGNTWKNSLMMGKRPWKTQFCAGWFEIFRKDGRLQETG